MMNRRGTFPRWLFILLIAGVLWAAGSAVYRAGWMQGYQTAALTAAASSAGQSGGQGAAPSPYLINPWMYGQGPWAFGPHLYGGGFGFFPFFPLIGIGFFLILIFLFGGLFRKMAFNRWAGGPGPHRWSEEELRAWRAQHGQQEAPAEDKPAE